MSTTGTGSSVARRPAGRPRTPGTDDRLRRVALDLLGEAGPGAVTMDAVAARSGVAKTTVYRRFANSRELLTSALEEAIGVPGEPPEADVRAKVRWSLEEIWARMSTVLGRGGVAALIAGNEPEFAASFRAVLAPYNTALMRLMAEDQARGLVRASLDIEVAVTLFAGAYAGRLIDRGEVDEAWLERCLDLMWVAIATPIQ